MTQRIQRHSYLAIFDGADPSVSTPRRASTTTPLQSLYLLNDPFVHTQTEKLAERLLADQANQSWNDAKLVQHAFQLCLARPATEHETDQALRHLRAVSSQNTPKEAWQSLARVLIRLNEFVYLD